MGSSAAGRDSWPRRPGPRKPRRSHRDEDAAGTGHCLAAIQSGETAECTEAGGLHGCGQSRESLQTSELHKYELQATRGTCWLGQVDGRLRWVCGPQGFSGLTEPWAGRGESCRGLWWPQQVPEPPVDWAGVNTLEDRATSCPLSAQRPAHH